MTLPEIINNWNIIKLGQKDNYGRQLVLAVCLKCNNEYVLPYTRIIHNNSTQCATCARKELAIKNSKNLVGNRYGLLLAIERLPKYDKAGRTHYRCICDCGNEKIIRGSTLTYNGVRSCGCLRHKKGLLPPVVVSKKPKLMFKSLYDNYKAGAVKRYLSFELSYEEFEILINKSCHYCNSEPSNTLRFTDATIKYNGIDRVDNTIGYELANCVPCCFLCNKMKSTIDKKEFYNHITKIYEHINIT